MDDETQHETSDALRLPLWKNVVEEMLRDCSYGQTYSAEYFETRLKTERATMRFGLDVANIRRALEHHGFYLSGRGLNGTEFILLPPENNVSQLESYQRKAIDALKRGVILGTNTRLDTLTPEQRAKHERTLEKIAMRSVLISRRIPRTPTPALPAKDKEALT